MKAEGPRARFALLVLLALSAAAVLGAPRFSASAAGEGIFELDKVEYSTPEGTAVLVTVKRTSGATLLNDVQVQLELEGGDPNVEYPASEQTKLVTFPKNTNLTQQSVFIQTLNQNRHEDKVIQVTIRSVGLGGIIGPISTAPITILGTWAPRVLDVSPKAGGNFSDDGTVLTITGQNFITTEASGGWSTKRIRFEAVVGGNAYETLLPTEFFNLTPTSVSVKVPKNEITSFTGDPNNPLLATYHVRVGIEKNDDTAQKSLSSATAADLFVYTTGPTVTSMFPKNGPPGGGTVVTLNGTKLNGTAGQPCGVTQVTFAGVPGTDCVFTGTNTLQVRSPEKPAFLTTPAEVTVSTGAGQTPPTSDTKFTYTGLSTITGLSPNFGPPSGGNTVVITGVNFILKDASLYDVPVSEVRFGGTSTTFVVESATRIVATAPAGTGTQQVTLVHPLAGTSQFTTAANYGYSAGPLVASISPDSGPVVGGTVVTITGTGFLPGATVKFGTTQATFATVVSPTRIDVTSPPGTGVVDVVVTVNANPSPTGPQARFSYSGPTVESISPIAGPPAGGGTITIKGKNFNSQSVVQFGASLSVIPTYVDTQTLTAVVPASPIVQAVHVRVSTGSGISPETEADVYTYTNGPIVDLVNPNNGPTTGGTIVIIIGKNFTAPLSVRFGDSPVDAFNINSATQITLLSPSNGTPGAVDVRVTKGNDVSPTGPATKFTYNSAVPKITALTPNTGSTFGGNEVVITGLGFTGASCPGSVKFGTVQAPECTVINDTTMTAKAPPNVSGAAVVLVTTQNGTSDIVPNYTYVSPSGTGGGSSAPPAPGPGGNESYTLTYRWSLLTWTGRNGMAVSDAVHGTGVPGASDLSNRITALFQWDAVADTWRAYFVGSDGVPGASDFVTLTQGAVYWVAISGEGAVPWVVPLN
ncbi:MAG: IPT/TIG domain-containing protein [Dehalococcoidia bacterium]|nr:IPT/TIG domain-containing protein [Dehalococcoidia bacterium]